MLINFTDKTFTAFHGTSLADMQKFNAEHDSYAFSNSGAANFNKVILGMASEQLRWDSTSKGAVSIDDFRVYTLDTPTPTASDMNITGKPNIGETLTATYGTYSEPNGIAEGNSYGYWESSDDFAFTNPVKLTDNIPLKADDTSSYTLTENESNKYVRFVVVPVTVDGYEGIRGTVLPQKIDSVFATLDVIGATTGDGKNFVFVNDKNYKSYGGRVTVNNTTRYEQNLFMITAWYKDNALENAYITPVTVSAGSAEESGMKTTTATLPTGSQKTFEDADSMSGYTLRVFLFKDLDNITPVCVNRMVTEPQS
jgi:hypothetical protein